MYFTISMKQRYTYNQRIQLEYQSYVLRATDPLGSLLMED